MMFITCALILQLFSKFKNNKFMIPTVIKNMTNDNYKEKFMIPTVIKNMTNDNYKEKFNIINFNKKYDDTKLLESIMYELFFN